MPESSHGPYTMTIQLIADGMQLAKPDATWRVDLPVTADAPYPTVTVDLVPDAQDEPVRASSIRAMYSIDGNPIGLAIRSVAIVRTAGAHRRRAHRGPGARRRPRAAGRPGRRRT